MNLPHHGKLIALTGLPRSGKDTAALHLTQYHGFERRAFAAPLKKAAAVLLARSEAEMNGENGFDREAILPEWGFTTRDFLQRLGTESVRNVFGADFWLKRMENSLPATGNVVITDCRFPNERELVKSFGGIVIEIRRPGTYKSGHASDAGVKADGVVHNVGSLNTLYAAMDEVVQEYADYQGAN